MKSPIKSVVIEDIEVLADQTGVMLIRRTAEGRRVSDAFIGSPEDQTIRDLLNAREAYDEGYGGQVFSSRGWLELNDDQIAGILATYL